MKMNGRKATAGLMVVAVVLVVGPFPAIGDQKESVASRSEVSQKSESSSSASSASSSDTSVKSDSASDISVKLDSASGISVKSENGKTSVTYKGKKVFEGQTSGMVTARTSNVNGTEYAAAFDGDKVIWQNTSGAAEQLKGDGGIKLPDLNQLMQQSTTKRRKES